MQCLHCNAVGIPLFYEEGNPNKVVCGSACQEALYIDGGLFDEIPQMNKIIFWNIMEKLRPTVKQLLILHLNPATLERQQQIIGWLYYPPDARPRIEAMYRVSYQRFLNTLFIRACDLGYASLVTFALKNGQDPSTNNNRAIQGASWYGRTGVVQLLLNYRNLDHPEREVNPAAEDNEAILFASKYGHTEVVQLLLTYRNLYHPEREVNPAAFDDYAIREASEYGHAEVVQLLLNYRNLDHPEREVNPAALNNRAIQGASWYGRTGVVRLLLADGRADPAARVNLAIRWASAMGQMGVVQLLLADPRVNPADYSNEAIRWASAMGQMEVVRLLLNYRNPDHPKREVNPVALDNEAIINASHNGRAEVVQLLLNYRNPDHPEREVNPAARDNSAIQWASERGHVEIVRLLLADPRVNRETFPPDRAREIRDDTENEEIRELLESYIRRLDQVKGAPSQAKRIKDLIF